MLTKQIGIQLVPPSEPLLASIPSGREYHVPKTFIPPGLDEESIIRMRAPPDPTDSAFKGDEDDSGDEDGRGHPSAPGAFPDSRTEHTAGTSYY
jgi:hypothetical protein